MITKKSISSILANWIEPLDLAAQIAVSDYQENWVFLYSGLSGQIDNSKSYLCLYPQKEIIADDFSELEKNLSSQYFGYLGYDLKNQLEDLQNGKKSFIDLPNLWMINFGLVLEFDHNEKQVSVIARSGVSHDVAIQKIISNKTGLPRRIKRLAMTIDSNFSKSEYFHKVKSIQTHIKNGDIYQANLTRKFFGKFTTKPQNPFEIFLKLNRESPANYSAFLKLDKNYIISSSPELFLKIDAQGKVLSSPIKGTAKRFKDQKLDAAAKKNLQNSSKEQAENLMIVDLVRNDLSRNCLAGSVRVENLFKISSYKTLHHLSSDICAIKNPQSSNLDIIKSCFPAGSMTGAPKIKAMEICQELEQQNRGVYSGAIGFIGAQDCELSVVIRTLIIKEDQFEFQVGGAITFDSNPQKEWQETINKAKGIAKTLGIKLSELRKI
ncbi:MAG: aminodeoxychorismate synthase component I [Pseudomonadota bacterium]